MKFYNDISEKLTPYVSHYWTTEGLIKEDQILLPMSHLDIVIPLKGSFTFTNDKKSYLIDTPYMHGLNTQKTLVHQEDYAFTFGITFTPWGFYAIYGKPMSNMANQILKVEDILDHFHQEYHDPLNIPALIQTTELKLESYLINDLSFAKALPILQAFTLWENNSVTSFINRHSISRRTLERMTKKYIGLTPKAFLTIKQFNRASKEIIFNADSTANDILYASDYYDQAHLSRQMKSATGHTPKELADKKITLKSHISYE